MGLLLCQVSFSPSHSFQGIYPFSPPSPFSCQHIFIGPRNILTVEGMVCCFCSPIYHHCSHRSIFFISSSSMGFCSINLLLFSFCSSLHFSCRSTCLRRQLPSYKLTFCSRIGESLFQYRLAPVKFVGLFMTVIVAAQAVGMAHLQDVGDVSVQFPPYYQHYDLSECLHADLFVMHSQKFNQTSCSMSSFYALRTPERYQQPWWYV